MIAMIDSYHWSTELPAGGRAVATLERMTAAEQMFFFAAPLAHVVAYEERLRTNLVEAAVLERARRQQARSGGEPRDARPRRRAARIALADLIVVAA